VTIWEAGPGGLFSSAAPISQLAPGSRTATIPEQVVARDGTIGVPYAGRLRVLGLKPEDVESAIVQRLKGKAIEPQAVVAVTRNVSNTVSVTGEVTNGARVPLTVRGDRVLDVIAAAGGLHIPANEASFDSRAVIEPQVYRLMPSRPILPRISFFAVGTC